MRRRIGTWVLFAGSLLALACVSDHNPLPTQPPLLSSVAPYPACSNDFTTLIISEINALYPNTPNLRQAALSQFSSVVKQCSKNPADAQSKAVRLAGFAAKKFASGQLVSGTPWGGVSSQIDHLYQYVGLPAPGIPAEAVGPNAAIAVVGPTDPPTVIETAGENPAGLIAETGAFSATQTVMVTIVLDPSGTNPFPNPSGFQEFPPFYDFQTFPPLASFNKPVLVGICVDLTEVPFEQAHRLQLAHPRHPDLTDLELLDRVDADFLPCDSYVRAGSPFARLAQRALALFRPRQLHAATLMPGGLGGLTGSFSDFRAVDPVTAQLNWTPQSSGTTNILFGVNGTDINDVFAVGDAGTILHYDGESWEPQPSGTPYRLYSVWAQGGFAVGEGTTILRYFPGYGWSTDISGQPGALTAIWGSSEGDVFAVGTGGTILRYGEGWETQTSGTTNQLNGIWGADGGDIFVVGLGGKILHYNGSSWTVQTIGTLNFRAVWGTSGSDVFAVGDGGTILHFDGEGWTAQVSGTTNSLEGVWGTSPTDVFAVGAGGTILHYDGTSWRPESSGTGQFLRGVWGLADDFTEMWVVGNGGTIQHGSSEEP